MKKLLSSLSAIAITASLATSVIACGNDEKENTGTQFINDDGELQIDTEQLLEWYTETRGYGDPIKVVKNFYNLFAVAVMQEATKEASTFFANADPKTNPYALEGLKEILAKEFGTSDSTDNTTVYGAANEAFAKLEKDTNDNKKLVDTLAKQFPNVKKEYDSLKKAYINNFLMTDSTNSAYARLTNLLAKTYQKGITNQVSVDQIKTTLIRDFISKYRNSTVKEAIKKVKELVEAHKAEDKEDKDYNNILNLLNATGGLKILTNNAELQIWKESEIIWANLASSKDNIKTHIDDLFKRLVDGTDENAFINEVVKDGSKTVNQNWKYIKKGKPLDQNSTYFDLVSNYPPLDQTAWSNKAGNQIYGFLSNSQRYLADNYFRSQKPVAISEVVFSKGSGDLEKNINGAAFFDSTTAKDAKQYTGFIDFLRNYVYGENVNNDLGNSQTPWDTIFANQDAKGTGQIYTEMKDGQKETWNSKDSTYYKTNNDGTLLTLSDTSHSNILKYSVYDYIQSESTVKANVENLNAGIEGLNLLEIKNSLSSYKDGSVFSADQARDIAVGMTKDATNAAKLADNLKKFNMALGLIEKLDRKVTNLNDEWSSSDDQKNNKVYQILNDELGIIAFIDTDGLHITKINGWQVLKNAKDVSTDQTATTSLKDNPDEYLKEVNTFSQLQAIAQSEDYNGNYRYIFGDFNKELSKAPVSAPGSRAETVPEQPEAKPIPAVLPKSTFIDDKTIEETKELGLSYDLLNKSISNKYERYLINTSINQNIGDKKNESFYKYNFLDSVVDYATSKDSSTTEMSLGGSWMFDYFIAATGQSSETIFEKLFTFDTSTLVGRKYQGWLFEKIDTQTQLTRNSGKHTFNIGWTDWTKAIDDTKNSKTEDNKDLPLIKLAFGNAKGDLTRKEHIEKMLTLINFAPYNEKKSYGFANTNTDRLNPNTRGGQH